MGVPRCDEHFEIKDRVELSVRWRPRVGLLAWWSVGWILLGRLTIFTWSEVACGILAASFMWIFSELDVREGA